MKTYEARGNERKMYNLAIKFLSSSCHLFVFAKLRGGDTETGVEWGMIEMRTRKRHIFILHTKQNPEYSSCDRDDSIRNCIDACQSLRREFVHRNCYSSFYRVSFIASQPKFIVIYSQSVLNVLKVVVDKNFRICRFLKQIPLAL